MSPQTSQPEQTNSVDSNTSSSEVALPKQKIESSSSNPSPGISSDAEEVSASPSTQLIPSAITPKEVKLREQQVQIAKEIERLETNYENAELGNRRDTLRETYRRLNSEIQLLQAQQLLQLKQQEGETKKQISISR